MKTTKREFIFIQAKITLLSVFMLLAMGKSMGAKDPYPSHTNIIFILSDDLGYGDLSCYGNPLVQSPHLDQLALDGQCLTQHYTAAPVCMPTRVALLTGKYPYRTGSRMTKDGRPPTLDNLFFPKLLKEKGYSTKIVGKWHLGNFPEGVKSAGFDEYAICAPGGWCDFWDYTIHTQNGNKPSEGQYATDMITEETLEFISKEKDNPFFVYVAYNAPHFPLQAPEEDIEPFKNIEGIPEGTAIVYGMIRHMDAGIGKIIQKLKETGLYENTLIVFTSDNGPRMGPYKGLDQRRYKGNLSKDKGHVAEGGIRVPAIIHWPEQFDPVSQTYPHMMHMVDWFKTLLDIAKVDIPQNIDIDGENYLNELLQNKPKKDVKRFWSYNKTRPTKYSNSAMRVGPWKLYRPEIDKFNSWKTEANEPFPEEKPDYELYRIDTDPFEKHDLSEVYPQKRKQMIKEFEMWYRKVEKEHETINRKRDDKREN